MPREVPKPHPWRTALLIFLGFVLLGFAAAVIIRYAFTPYRMLDQLPEDRALLEK